jgi:hypothetical protein
MLRIAALTGSEIAAGTVAASGTMLRLSFNARSA